MGWIVSQFGARQHYATPKAFQRRGTLDRFYTDQWAGQFRPLLSRAPGRLRAFKNRWAKELPPAKVVSFTLPTIYDLLTRHVRVEKGSAEADHLEYIREGKRFCARVNRDLAEQQISSQSTVFYGCKSVALETLQLMRDRGIFSILDQPDPAAVEEKLVQAESEKWPGWQALHGKIPEEYYDRCRQEWGTASMVLVYSKWTRQAIIDQGADAEKVVVVPLAYETSNSPQPRSIRRDEPLTVLWLSTVSLRKGIPYLLEAARLMQHRPIKFVVAGQLMISEKAVATAPPNVQFIGRVLRGTAAAVYQSADLFVLPTISDSFALTQVEAMSYGLPVIATDRCGQVITPGIDGQIIPSSDANALAAAITSLDDNRELLREMSINAVKKAMTFSIENYGRLVCDEVLKRRPDLANII